MSFVERLRRLLGVAGPSHPSSREPGGHRGGCGALSCTDAIEKVHEYLDGEMEEEAAAEVAHHFEVCQQCFPHLRLEERFREALRQTLAKEQCPDSLRTQVLELLAVESQDQGKGIPPGSSSP